MVLSPRHPLSVGVEAYKWKAAWCGPDWSLSQEVLSPAFTSTAVKSTHPEVKGGFESHRVEQQLSRRDSQQETVGGRK